MGNVVAIGGWLFAVLFMLAGSIVGLTTGHGWLTSMLLAWGLFLSAAAGTLTIKECTRRNRQVFTETVELIVEAKAEHGTGSVAKIR
jgi:hypothetical protein